MRCRKYFICIAVLLMALLGNGVRAQETYRFSGVVKSEKNDEPVAFANVVLKEVNQWGITKNDGSFVINQIHEGQYILIVSCMGYEKLETPITIKGNVLNYQIRLMESMEDIDEVVVIAQESRQNGTSSLIKRDAIKHVQPSSFADIMELIPGGVSQKNGLTTMKLLHLRVPTDVYLYKTTVGEFNSSLGTSFVVDGVPLSNDASIQNVTGSYNEDYLYYRNTTGKGIDMRLIPTDDIESVEVIRGIPSVKYGDLTSGVIDIKRAYRVDPLRARIKANEGTKLFALGKGYRLGETEILNANIDYVDYKSDPRNPLVNYTRFTGSFRFSDVQKEGKNKHELKVSLDYTGSFDESKRDPEIDNKQRLKNSYNQVRLGSTLDWEPQDKDWLEMLSYSISGSYTFDRRRIQRSVSGGFTPIMTNRDAGEFYGEFLPFSYIGNLTVKNIPVHLYAMLSANLRLPFAGRIHNVLIGTEWEYDKNHGKGEIYDETRPVYAGVGRPRKLNDIPSIQKFSVFAEEQVKIPVGRHVLTLQVGLRGAMAMNLSSEYTMSDRFYWDPRTNLSWNFPSFNVMDRKFELTLNTGYGWQTKFPVLAHLYPDLSYVDRVQLNYYSSTRPELRRVQYKTWIIDNTNHNLKPNRNEKVELGFTLRSDKVRMDIGAYYERLKDGYKMLNSLNVLNYKLYDIESGPEVDELTGPPTVDMFNSEAKRDFLTSAKRGNGSKEIKKGVEYQIDLGEVDAIRSRVSVNGAWMYVDYDLSEGYYKGSSAIMEDEKYPYIGYYTWSSKSKSYEQFNTNFRFDTNLKEMGLIFSTSLQCMWFKSMKYIPHNGMPDYYIDKNGNMFPYTEEHTKDPVLKFLYDKPDPHEFDERREPFAADLNLTVSKTIGDNIDLSFYVNRILNYYPSYTQSNGARVHRNVTPYFGMELKINL
ncbi:TonB-dependent receptor [Puteibacter caeruleilacunae]|nr:TonB-dependent receptor [Puteibacter caeruleilacunae]